MENASKALIMAGAVLVAIMIVSLGILMFNNFGNTVKETANMDEQEIANYNSKISPYLGNSISGSQVNALLQYCVSVNIAANKSGETYKNITVTKGGTVILSPSSNSYTRVPTGGGVFYSVQGTPNSDGLITSITIN